MYYTNIHFIISQVERSNQEKTKLDGVLRGLNDEVLHRDESIAKLNKEKKYINEHMGKASEELNTNTDKLNHLNDIKSKLEKTFDQMEGAVEAEKRAKANIEKERRKMEGDLKMSQEAVGDMERRKREIEQAIMRKDTEMHQMMNKLDDEQSGMNRYSSGPPIIAFQIRPILLICHSNKTQVVGFVVNHKMSNINTSF